MTDKYTNAVKGFNDFADSFELKFMNFKLYDKSIEDFCSLVKCKSPLIFEIGCGPGNVTQRVKRHIPDANITAIDLAENMLTIARRNVPDVNFINMDARDIDTLSETYNAIIAAFITPFLSFDDCSLLFKNISKKLSPGGYFYLSTMEGTPDQCGYETTSFTGETAIHFTYYELSFLVHELEKNGLSVVHSHKQPYLRNNIPILTDIIIYCQKR